MLQLECFIQYCVPVAKAPPTPPMLKLNVCDTAIHAASFRTKLPRRLRVLLFRVASDSRTGNEAAADFLELPG